MLEAYAGCRVLVVDDNEANGRLVQKLLARSGLSNVDVLTNSRGVVGWVAENDPDLVLLDLHMPDPDGFAVLQQLRTSRSPLELPVLVLTADVTREASDRAFELGANDFLLKPLARNEVVHRVRNLLEMQTAHAALVRRERWLEDSLIEVRQLEQAREALFATISHDLRTPLTAIMAFAELMAESDADEHADLCSHILRNADRLRAMVDNLVDHARIRSGAEMLNIMPIDVAGVARDCSRDLDVVLASHDVTVAAQGPRVLADQKALERVLANLLVNAVKYSPNDTTISVTFGQDPPYGLIRVSDHGRGILAEDLAVIFDEFQRGALATADGGTGLGLASVRKLVEQQQGQVSIVSEVGSGTTVTVALPLAE